MMKNGLTFGIHPFNILYWMGLIIWTMLPQLSCVALTGIDSNDAKCCQIYQSHVSVKHIDGVGCVYTQTD